MKQGPTFFKNLKLKVSLSYLSKIRIDKNLNTHLLLQNDSRVN